MAPTLDVFGLAIKKLSADPTWSAWPNPSILMNEFKQANHVRAAIYPKHNAPPAEYTRNFDCEPWTATFECCVPAWKEEPMTMTAQGRSKKDAGNAVYAKFIEYWIYVVRRWEELGEKGLKGRDLDSETMERKDSATWRSSSSETVDVGPLMPGGVRMTSRMQGLLRQGYTLQRDGATAWVLVRDNAC
jgi:hypothetical protein